MVDNVIGFKKKEPPKDDGGQHAEGPARCMNCGHKWHAVAPVGTWGLECSHCGTFKGVFEYLFRETGYSWVCKCGGELFMCAPYGALCIVCGVAHQYKDM